MTTCFDYLVDALGGDLQPALAESWAPNADGSVWTWGSNYSGQLGDGTTTDSFTPKKVAGLTGTHPATAIGAGLALLNDGTVWAWGDNSDGQLGTGSSAGFSPLRIRPV